MFSNASSANSFYGGSRRRRRSASSSLNSSLASSFASAYTFNERMGGGNSHFVNQVFDPFEEQVLDIDQEIEQCLMTNWKHGFYKKKKLDLKELHVIELKQDDKIIVCIATSLDNGATFVLTIDRNTLKINASISIPAANADEDIVLSLDEFIIAIGYKSLVVTINRNSKEVLHLYKLKEDQLICSHKGYAITMDNTNLYVLKDSYKKKINLPSNVTLIKKTRKIHFDKGFLICFLPVIKEKKDKTDLCHVVVWKFPMFSDTEMSTSQDEATLVNINSFIIDKSSVLTKINQIDFPNWYYTIKHDKDVVIFKGMNLLTNQIREISKIDSTNLVTKSRSHFKLIISDSFMVLLRSDSFSLFIEFLQIKGQDISPTSSLYKIEVKLTKSYKELPKFYSNTQGILVKSSANKNKKLMDKWVLIDFGNLMGMDKNHIKETIMEEQLEIPRFLNLSNLPLDRKVWGCLDNPKWCISYNELKRKDRVIP